MDGDYTRLLRGILGVKTIAHMLSSSQQFCVFIWARTLGSQYLQTVVGRSLPKAFMMSAIVLGFPAEVLQVG